MEDLDKAIDSLFLLAEERDDEELLGYLSPLEDAYRRLDTRLNAEKAEAWDEAKREVAMIPCWVNTETGLHGFDLADGETGARMAVMEVLDNNPYLKQETP